MFATVFRQQARLALARQALPTTRPAGQVLAPRLLAPNFSVSVSRTFSSTSLMRYESNSSATHAPSNTLWVGNVAWSTDEAELKEKFSAYGKVVEIRIGQHPDGRPRGFAHIQFASQEDAIAAHESSVQEPFHMNGRDLRTDFAPSQTLTPNNKLYFKNFNGDETEMREILRDNADSITDVYCLRYDGELRGNGFIEFVSIEAATEVLERFNAEQNTFAFSYAKPKAEGDRRGGSGERTNRDYGGGGERTNRDYGGGGQRRGGGGGGGYGRGGRGGGGGGRGGGGGGGRDRY